MKKTLYDVLQVSSKAEPEMIETAFRIRSEKLGDAVDPDAQNELRLVRQAYEILSHPDKRAMYDQSLLSVIVRSRAVAYPDGMEEDEGGGNSSILKWGVASVVALTALLIVLNYSRDTKKIEVDAQNTSKHLDNEQELVIGTVSNQSKAIDNTTAVSNRIIDLAQERELSRRLAEQQRIDEMNRLREQQMESSRKAQEAARQQQEAMRAAQQEEEGREQYRKRMMNNMISLKEWDNARSFAKTSYELSYINQMEQADKRAEQQYQYQLQLNQMNRQGTTTYVISPR